MEDQYLAVIFLLCVYNKEKSLKADGWAEDNYLNGIIISHLCQF